jgi:hypothetical protein
MKSQKNQFPRFLAALPQIDFFQPDDEPTDPTVASPFDITDFQLICSSPVNPGTIMDYTELHLDSVAGGGTIPIKSQDDPERVMFIGGLPPVRADWSMSIVFTQGDFSDTVKMSRVAGKFLDFRLSLASRSPLVFENPDVFFTVEKGPRRYETYVNVNIEGETALLEHSDASTFDQFGLSLLGRSK